jgi:membrane associated rhomboid family serine protease
VSNIFTDKQTGNFSSINFIITITVAIQTVVFLMPQIGNYLVAYGGLSPEAVIFDKEVWRLISYAFLHDPRSFFHIVFNMLILWMFGKEIEYVWGYRRFFEFYLFSALFAGAFSLLAVFFNFPVNIIGASGALMALLVVYAYYFPDRQLLFFFVIPMKVRTAVIIYAVISIFGTARSAGNVSHITHLGGIVAGFIWIKIEDKFDLAIRGISAFFNNISTKRNRYKIENEQTGKRCRAEEVDRILDKINDYGIQSLSPQERKILQEASADYRKKGF